MLTYNSRTNVGFLFQCDADPAKAAQEMFAPGSLVRAKSSLLAKAAKEPRPGITLQNWGSTKRGYEHLTHFTPDKILFVVKSPVWCLCPRHFEAFAKRPRWVEEHLGYASFMFLYGETLFEALTPLRKDEGYGQELLVHMSESYLRKHPEMVFIPLVEAAKPGPCQLD